MEDDEPLPRPSEAEEPGLGQVCQDVPPALSGTSAFMALISATCLDLIMKACRSFLEGKASFRLIDSLFSKSDVLI